MKKLIVGNWKMNGSKALVEDLVPFVVRDCGSDAVDVCLCPPFVYLDRVSGFDFPKNISVGAQDCSYHGMSGAYTGDVSAAMLKEAGCEYVILGHSERRQYHCETNNIIAKKAEHAIAAGLKVIICVGETENERQEGLQNPVVIMQLKESVPEVANGQNLVIAYEPVWAIGTGKSATPDDVREMHGVIRRYVQEKLDNPESVRILYGGSVKPENAVELLHIENVDGALVGGASLNADQFLAIVTAAQ
ncbi:MAG: triose-phosphate isomerase [Pseudobdellovibrionaceae bacterium]|jgi:triosephosphate isomerase|nr:triose-phosphate isomerase [Pseudobdellovibrionaceae bacterium]